MISSSLRNFGPALVLLSGLTFAQNTAPFRSVGSISGRVRTAVDQPVSGAVVSLRQNGKQTSTETTSDRLGEYSFSPVTPGSYTVTAQKPGWKVRRPEVVTLTAGEDKNASIVLEPVAASTSSGIEFDDKPNFTVAGVTDWNNVSIHGSDVSTRTSEALTKDTLALKSGEGASKAAAATDVSKNPTTADGHRRLGDLDEQSGDSLGAVREYEQAVHLDPSEPNYFAWGTELLLHRAEQPAVAVFTKGSKAHPRSARLLEGLGAALSASGAYEEAARHLCQAADLHPADPTPYLFLGKVEKAAEAALPCGEPTLARFARQSPGNAMANYYNAIAVWKKERTLKDGTVSQAERLLEKALKIDPTLGEAYLQLGIIHAARGKVDEAITNYKKALEVSPQLGEAHYRLGSAYRRAGREEDAKRELQLYEQGEKLEAAALERQRKEVQQFLIVLKDAN